MQSQEGKISERLPKTSTHFEFSDESEGKRVKKVCEFFDESLGKNRSITDIDWSPKVSLTLSHTPAR